jgi:hypothetical protein
MLLTHLLLSRDAVFVSLLHILSSIDSGSVQINLDDGYGDYKTQNFNQQCPPAVVDDRHVKHIYFLSP